MSLRVGHFDCRFRHRAGDVAAASVVARLERLAPEALVAAEAGTLQDLARDERVVVLREVTLRLRLRVHGHVSDEELRSAWGRALADGITEAAGTGGEGIVVYPTRAARLAARLLSHLSPGPRWPETPPEGTPALSRSAEADLLRLLAAEPAIVGAVLAELRAQGKLDALFDCLSPDGMARLWRFAAPPPSLRRPELRVLLRITAALFERLGTRAPAQPDSDALSDALAAAVPELLNWRNRECLARAVLAAVRVLCERSSALPLSAGPAGIAAAVQPMDWVDRDALAAGLAALAGTSRGEPSLAARKSQLTDDDPGERLPAIRARLRAEIARLAGPARSSASALRLRLLAVLAAEWPALASDPAALLLLDRIAAESEPAPSTALGASPAVPGADAPGADPGHFIRSIVDPRDDARAAPWLSASDAAGVLLLVRGILDSGLLSFLTSAGCEQARPALLRALGRLWAGPTLRDPDADPALGWLAGDGPDTAQPTFAILEALTDSLARTARTRRVSIPDAHGAFTDMQPLMPCPDALVRIASAILAVWAAWLPGFVRSSPAFLLASFVRRPGRLALRGSGLAVELDPRPLDLVLSRAGYLDPLELRDWGGTERLTFSIAERRP